MVQARQQRREHRAPLQMVEAAVRQSHQIHRVRQDRLDRSSLECPEEEEEEPAVAVLLGWTLGYLNVHNHITAMWQDGESGR